MATEALRLRVLNSIPEAIEKDKLQVGKGGLPPLVGCPQSKRGQAALPNHEIPYLK
jgi:hypothetical protein